MPPRSRVVDGISGDSHEVHLKARIADGDQGLNVSATHRRKGATDDLDVLLGHRPRSIPGSRQLEAAALPDLVAVAPQQRIAARIGKLAGDPKVASEGKTSAIAITATVTPATCAGETGRG